MCETIEPSLLVSKLEQGLFQFTNSWRNDPGTYQPSVFHSTFVVSWQRAADNPPENARRSSWLDSSCLLTPYEKQEKKKEQEGKKKNLVSSLNYPIEEPTSSWKILFFT